MNPGRTHFADDATLKRLLELENENKKLRGLLEDANKVIEKKIIENYRLQDTLRALDLERKRLRAAYAALEGKR